MSFLQNNYLVFMAELFWWFEVVKPSFVQPRVLDAEGNKAKHEGNAFSYFCIGCRHSWDFYSSILSQNQLHR